MEPVIRYCTTSDGVNIAFWTIGDGPRLLYMFPVASHVELEWKTRIMQEIYVNYARRHTLIRYDRRGEGLSDHVVTGFTLEAYCSDIDAVLDAIGIDRCSIVAYGSGGIAAVAFAATRPGRVEKLALWAAVACDQDYPAVKAIVDLAEANFDAYGPHVRLRPPGRALALRESSQSRSSMNRPSSMPRWWNWYGPLPT